MNKNTEHPKEEGPMTGLPKCDLCRIWDAPYAILDDESGDYVKKCPNCLTRDERDHFDSWWDVHTAHSANKLAGKIKARREDEEAKKEALAL